MTYSSSGKSSPGEGLAAREHTPWIGVHAMTEFMFCPRAGLISYELGQEDDDEYYEEQRTNLQYLPCYNSSEIATRLNWSINELQIRIAKRDESLLQQQQLWKKRLVVTSAIAFVATVVICFLGFNSWLHLLMAGIAYLFALSRIPKVYYSDSNISSLESDIKILQARRAAVLRAKPKEPDPLTDNESVNWWDLLAAGFESVSYQEPLRDRKWRVAGRPWRVLKKGSLRIPVWRRKDENASTRKLKGQHYARMAAYCHLLEKAEGGRSPYGIVLLGREVYEGITVSNGVGSRAAFHKGLKEARHIVSSAKGGQNPSPPDQRNCLNCPKGKPFAYREGESDARTGRLNSPVNLHVSGIDRRYYHSECGDRFKWLPPHQKASDKYLQ